MLTLILFTTLATGSPDTFGDNISSMSTEPAPIVKTIKKAKEPCCPGQCCPDPAGGNLDIKNS